MGPGNAILLLDSFIGTCAKLYVVGSSPIKLLKEGIISAIKTREPNTLVEPKRCLMPFYG